MMLTRIADSAAADEEPIMVARAGDDQPGPAALELSHRISPAGEAVVAIGGELDIATAELQSGTSGRSPAGTPGR
jgi:hypothetical protein